MVVTEIQPIKAHSGDKIKIKGSNFGEDPSIINLSIGGASAKIDSINNESLVITVPRSASSGLIELTKDDQTIQSSFQLLEPRINLNGSVGDVEWDMQFGRTLEDGGKNYEVILYSKDWAKTLKVCKINSWEHGYIYFSVPKEVNSYSFSLNSQFIKLQGFSFCVTTARDDTQYTGTCLGEGNATVEIKKINKYFIIGSLRAEGANGSVSGDFVVDICD